MNRTKGDQYSVDCPSCGKPIKNLWRLSVGLYSGAKIKCDNCGKEVRIEWIDRTVEIGLVTEDKEDNQHERKF